jgi:endonuclease/exonuclease/phosphatase family metal-dependent hydrolase
VRVRILVYNVRSFRGGVGSVAGVVASYRPDVALINECGPRRRLRRFARSLHMDAVSRHFLFRKSIHNAVLVRPPWRVTTHRLHRFPRDARRVPRGVLLARIGRAGTRLWALSVHLGLHPGSRRRNAEEVTNLVLSLGEPVLLGGDLNERPDGRAATWLAERFWDAWTQGAREDDGATFPSAGPTARIDYLFISEEFAIEDAITVRTREAAEASDHLPVLVDLSLQA